MCGIAGYYSQQDRTGDLRKMLALISHRGPDGEGLLSFKNGAFGHRRLAIIDVESGAQPMKDTATGVVLTFNGEIYNYVELRKELKALGALFTTNSDSEVLLQAYLAFGEDLLPRLRGMFAFAIYDPRTQKLFAARDRFGIKPFYYYQQNENLFFASEIKALTPVIPRAERTLNREALGDYLYLQAFAGRETLLNGVYRLEPGQCLSFSAGRLDIRTYWQLPQHGEVSDSTPNPKAIENSVEEIRHLVQESVRLHLRSDVPIGAYLSGGLDSAILCGIAKEELSKSFPVFTGRFSKEGSMFDDWHFAQKTANHLGLHHVEIDMNENSFAEHFEELIWKMDEPQAGEGALPQYLNSQRAREHVKVCLGGQGADEVFAGYVRYFLFSLDGSMRGSPGPGLPSRSSLQTMALQELLPGLDQINNYTPLYRKILDDWNKDSPALSRYLRMARVAPEIFAALHRDWCVSDLIPETEKRFLQPLLERDSKQSLLNSILEFDGRYTLPALLHVEDRVSMAWGLESRVPFLDHVLVEAAWKTPDHIKLSQGRLKTLLRQATQDYLAPAVLNRKEKIGFPVPLNAWSKKQLKGWVEDLLLDPRTLQRGIFSESALRASLRDGERPFGRALWGMICLEQWCRKFLDN